MRVGRIIVGGVKFGEGEIDLRRSLEDWVLEGVTRMEGVYIYII